MPKTTSARPSVAKPQVLVANEPRAYREVISVSLSELRPEIDFVLIEPENLAEAVTRLCPDMVICERVSATIIQNVSAWLELHPQDGPHSFLGLGGTRSRIENIQLSDILVIVDQAVGHSSASID